MSNWITCALNYLIKNECLIDQINYESSNPIVDSISNEMKENMAIINSGVVETTTYELSIIADRVNP